MTPAKEWPDGPLVFGHDYAISKFVQQQSREAQDFGPCATIGIVRNGQLLGGVVYHAFQPQSRTVTVSFAFSSPAWASKSVMCSICRYPFIQLECQRVNALVRKKNKRSRRFVEWLGFKQEGCARRGFGDDDAIIYGMLRQECRWLGE